jgi:hypothetical protein
MKEEAFRVNDRDIARWAQVSGDRASWQELAERLDSLPPETAYVLSRAMAWRLRPKLDPRTGIRDDNDAVGMTLAGAAYLTRAVRVRGARTADHVTDEQWERYFALREEAEPLLRAALAVRPNYGLCAAWLMALAVDEADDFKDEAEAALRGATAVPVSGFSKLLSARAEKWGGSHRAMWQIARSFAQRRPPWTAALIAKAHYEHHLYLAQMDEDADADARAEAYFRNASVREELLQLSEALWEGTTRDPYEAIFGHDVLAATFAAAEMPEQAVRHMRQTGRFGDPALLSGGPWWRRALMRKLHGLPLW